MTPGAPEQLDEITTRVLAPNPSHMTLDGTNTYLLGKPGAGELVVVDPGPELEEHRDAIDAAVAERDAAVVAVIVTHHHADHAEAAGWASGWGAPLHAFSPELIRSDALPLRDGDVLGRAGVQIEALHTPGHASDHLCLRLAGSGAILTGDHVLGRGSTVVAWPDGDMGAYMASLERLAAIEATTLHPGHGPSIGSPATKVAEYLAHRRSREEEVLAALLAGDTTPREIVERVYADVDPVLHPAAERSVRAHLDKLVEERAITRDDAGGPAAYRA
jgi:glyoxylase-like metal-dependent hydrolase (beta-lactamase superfamily II)